MLKRIYFLTVSILLLLSFSPLIGAAPIENWKLEKVGANHQIEGYVSKPSYMPGDLVDFHISCKSGKFKTDIYRLGWYSGSGAGLVSSIPALKCSQRNIPSPLASTGLVDPIWPATFRLQTSTKWITGIYLAKLTSQDGYQNYVPFCIRVSQPSSPYLFVHSLNTDNAYNIWGGNSLYHGYTPALKIARAVKASFNRPFSMPGGSTSGAGNLLTWEYPMISFLDKYGYKIDYVTDVDIHENPNMLLKYKAVIITGHNEYWSRQMFDGYKNALAHGVNLAVFGANTAYRPVRFEPDPVTREPDRIMVNFKSAKLDPITKTDPEESTPNAWGSSPLNEEASSLLGISYANETGDKARISADLVVSDSSSWIFRGTGLKSGDVIPNIVGYEYDHLEKNLSYPKGLDIVFHSPIIDISGRADYADSSYYKIPRGGQVFDAGTIEWSWGLDPTKPTFNSVLVKVTENILNRFGDS